MTFAEQLESIRERLGLTQTELSDLLEVPRRTLWDWEHAVSVPLPVTQEGVMVRLQKAAK